MDTSWRPLIIASLVLMACAFTACRMPDERASILLFNGTGVSPNDVTAVEEVLRSQHLDYATVNSWQLNRMEEAQLRRHRLLIVPGGNFVDMGNSLTERTAANVRTAVQNGLNYLGLCAGAFLAGNSPFHGLNLTSGVKFPFYSAENQGVRKTAVAIAGPEGTSLDQYCEDGPQLTGWGAVVGKYPDGTPAVAEGNFGGGWVILSGVHPEAPERWRRGMTFRTSADEDHAYAATLIRAALDRVSLPHY